MKPCRHCRSPYRGRSELGHITPSGLWTASLRAVHLPFTWADNVAKSRRFRGISATGPVTASRSC